MEHLISEEMYIVIFEIDKEEYCVPVTQAREIQNYIQPTKIPNTPDFIEGVINIREQLVPILDLKKKFGKERKEINDKTRIIIIEINDELMGVIVDHVSEVLKVNGSIFKKAPSRLRTSINNNYISGIGNLDNRIVVLIDLNKILNEDELEQMDLGN